MKKNLLTLILLILTVCWSNSVFAQPANNECSGAITIAAVPGFPLTYGPYDNTDATSEASDPVNPGFPDGAALENTTWYTLTGDGNTYFIYTSAACSGFNIPGGDYITDGDSQIAVYTGECGALELVTFDEDNIHVPEYDLNGVYPAGAIIPTEMGVTYHIMIDGYLGSAGQFCIVVTDWVCDANIELAEGQETAINLCSNESAEIAINEGTLNFGGVTLGLGLEYGTSWQMTAEDPMGGHPRFDPSFLGFVPIDFAFNGQTDGTDPFNFGLPCLWITPTSTANIAGTGSAFLAFDCQAVGTESIQICFIADGEGDCGDFCAEANVDLLEDTPLEVTLCEGDVFFIAPNDATINYGGFIGDNPVPAYLFTTIEPIDGNPLAGPDSTFLGFLVTDPDPLTFVGDGVADDFWVTITLFEDFNGEIPTVYECAPFSQPVHVIFLDADDPACSVVECGIAEGDAGTISTDDPTTFCVGDGEDDIANFTSSYAGMGNYGYLITDADGTILSPGVVGTTSLTQNFDGAGVGVCNVWGITWEGEGFTDIFVQGENVIDILTGLGEDACYELTDPIAITREECDPLATSAATTSAGDETYTVSFSVSGGSGNYSATGGTIDANGTFTSDAIACGTAYSFTVTDTDTNETAVVSGDAPCELVVVDCPIFLDITEVCAANDEGGTVNVTIIGGSAPYTVTGTYSEMVEGNSFSFVVGENEEYNIDVAGNDDCGSAIAVGILVCSKCGNEGGSVVETSAGSSTACGTANVSVTASGSVVTDGSVIVYILHSDQANPLGSVLTSNTTGVFSRADAGGVGTYYVTAYVGVDGNFNGSIDFFGDECTVSSSTLAVTFADGADLTITAQEDCDQNTETVTVTFTISGGTPGASFAVTGGTFEGTVGAGGGSFSGVADGDVYTINVTEIGGCASGSLTSAPVICQKEDAVEWLSFEGEVQTTGNFLQWVTASETNNEYFAVERSLDGKNFEVIATVNAKGESVTPTSYSYLDRSASAGTNYYRITQFDFDGQNDATQVISLTRGEGSFTITNVRPVPAVDYIEVTFSATNSNSVELSVYDLTGRVMLKATVNPTTGINNQTIDVSAYPAGIYMISLNNGTEVATQRLVKE
ncbi:MAG: T9SS type A sorting domain-containing protein [Chitinophagales bacterium]